MLAIGNPLKEHRDATVHLAESLTKMDVYRWIIEHGYYPENYVLPPCFRVAKCPPKAKIFYKPKRGNYKPSITDCVTVHFPKTDFTDRNFGIIHPEIHNDIAYHLATNWKTIVKTLFPDKSKVVSYSFPLPVDSKNPGRLSFLRSGRMIYEFIGMVDDDIASIAYKFTHLVMADIKNFYPSIYTHSIPWAIHGKKNIRKTKNKFNYKLVGNRLDKLFQNANDGCTNGIPIGPVVSDIIAEIIAAGVDTVFTQLIQNSGVECEAIRFKDDYRILVKSENDAKRAIKCLQQALIEYNLELSDSKTKIFTLPDGLFREWVSKYHLVNPKKKRRYSWKEFREIYLSVIQIDRECPGTGIIDRFLADIITKDGTLKVNVQLFNLQKVISMLLMLGVLRVKAFPKIVAILEKIIQSPLGIVHQGTIVEYLESYLQKLSIEEERNKYLISWICYFLVSNDLKKMMSYKPKYKDPITRTIFNNRSNIFNGCKEFKLFEGCLSIGKKVTMIEHLDVFNPPKF